MGQKVKIAGSDKEEFDRVVDAIFQAATLSTLRRVEYLAAMDAARERMLALPVFVVEDR